MSGEQLKSQQIEHLLASRLSAFEDWISNTGAHQSLAIPKQFGDVFIPRRILELSQEPANVHVNLLENQHDHLRVVILEQFEDPISDPEKFRQWEVANPSGLQVVHDPYFNTEAPKGIDYKHIRYLPLIKAGILKLTDKMLLDYYADVPYPYRSVVQTRNLHDRPELHGQGIGSSFYQRLEDVLKALGFGYLAGSVISPHPGFFSKSRFAFKDLSSEVQAQLPAYYAKPITGEKESRWMIRLL